MNFMKMKVLLMMKIYLENGISLSLMLIYKLMKLNFILIKILILIFKYYGKKIKVMNYNNFKK